MISRSLDRDPEEESWIEQQMFSPSRCSCGGRSPAKFRLVCAIVLEPVEEVVRTLMVAVPSVVGSVDLMRRK
jgi:hypothetical protein